LSQEATGDTSGASLRPRIEALVEKFNERAKTDEKLHETLVDWERSIQLDITGDGTYHFFLKDFKIDRVNDGPTPDPQIHVATDRETFEAVIDGETSPMRAYMNKKFRVKAELRDLLILRKLF